MPSLVWAVMRPLRGCASRACLMSGVAIRMVCPAQEALGVKELGLQCERPGVVWAWRGVSVSAAWSPPPWTQTTR